MLHRINILIQIEKIMVKKRRKIGPGNAVFNPKKNTVGQIAY